MTDDNQPPSPANFPVVAMNFSPSRELPFLDDPDAYPEFAALTRRYKLIHWLRCSLHQHRCGVERQPVSCCKKRWTSTFNTAAFAIGTVVAGSSACKRAQRRGHDLAIVRILGGVNPPAVSPHLPRGRVIQ